MSDDCTILDPINTINPATSIVQYAKQQFTNVLSQYGGVYTRQKITKTLNSIGSVTAISSEYFSVKVFFFDRFKSNNIRMEGVAANDDSQLQLKNTTRAYIGCDDEINSGEYLLVDYNSTDNSYREKYYIVEKEVHEVGGTAIFFTLYLRKEAV